MVHLFAELILREIKQFDIVLIFNLIEELFKQLEKCHEVKFCEECKPNNTESDTCHEFVDIVSLAVKLLFKMDQNQTNAIAEEQWKRVSRWIETKMVCLRKLNCKKAEQQKSQAESELRQMQDKKRRDKTSVFYHITIPSETLSGFEEMSEFILNHSCVVKKVNRQRADKQWRYLLRSPFYEFGSWYADLDLNNSLVLADDNCLCDDGEIHLKNTQILVKVAVDMFNISRKLQNNLKNPLTGSKIQRMLDEDEAGKTLEKTAKVIDDLLSEYVDHDHPPSLDSDEIDFCLRAIDFIKVHLIIFKEESFTFLSLPKLIKKRMDNECKLSVATLLTEYSSEYSDQVEYKSSDEDSDNGSDNGSDKSSDKDSHINYITSPMGEFFDECEDLKKKPDNSPKTKLSSSAFMGLMYKRFGDNDRGNEYLKPIWNGATRKVVHLKYLATKFRKTEGKDLVKPEAEYLNPLAYIQSIGVTESFYQRNEEVKMLTAALQAICVAKEYFESEADKIALAEFITVVLGICQKLQLQKQTVNLLLILASIQREEPKRFEVRFRLNFITKSLVINLHILSTANCPIHSDESANRKNLPWSIFGWRCK